MKKTISLMLAALMFVTVLSACKENDNESGGKKPTASVSVQDTAATSDNEKDSTVSNNKKNKTTSDNEKDATVSDNKKNKTSSDNEKNKTTYENKNVTTNSGNSKTGSKSDKKEDSKSDNKGDIGSPKVTSSSETESQPVVINPLPGEKLASKVGFNKKLNAPEFDLRGKILIARTYEEFKEIYDNDVGKSLDKFEYFHLEEEDNYILKYDENFFEENALIVVFSYEPSGSNRVKIDGVSKKDGELFVGVISKVPGPGHLGTDDVGCWRTLIEVKKSDIADITKITRIKSEI